MMAQVFTPEGITDDWCLTPRPFGWPRGYVGTCGQFIKAYFNILLQNVKKKKLSLAVLSGFTPPSKDGGWSPILNGWPSDHGSAQQGWEIIFIRCSPSLFLPFSFHKRAWEYLFQFLFRSTASMNCAFINTVSIFCSASE